MGGWRRGLEVIGGPNLVTWLAFWVLITTSAAGTAVTNIALPASIPVKAAIAVASATGCWLILLGYLLLRRMLGGEFHPILAIFVLVLAGAVRGILIDVAFLHFGLAAEQMLLFRIISGVISVDATLVISAFISTQLREQATHTAELREVTVTLEQARERAGQELSDSSDDVVVRIQEQLARELAGLDPASPKDSLLVLQRTAAQVVRPLSHELASNVPTWVPSGRLQKREIHWRSIFTSGLAQRPFMPLLTALSMALFALPSSLWIGTGLLKILVPIVVFLVTWFLVLIGNEVMWLSRELRGTLRVTVTVAIISVIGVLEAVLLAVIFMSTGEVIVSVVAVGATMFVPFFVGSFGVVNSITAEQRATQAHLREREGELRWQLARVGQVQWYQQRALSRALHGPMQSAVNAAAIRLDSAMRAGEDTKPVIQDAQTQLLEAVDAIGQLGSDERDALRVGVERIAQLWDGIAVISVSTQAELEARLATDHIAGVCILEVLNESTSNAIRHGGASTVAIDLSQGERAAVLTITDDGVWRNARATGLGSMLLDETAIGWNRQPNQDGTTTLTAQLPVSDG